MVISEMQIFLGDSVLDYVTECRYLTRHHHSRAHVGSRSGRILTRYWVSLRVTWFAVLQPFGGTIQCRPKANRTMAFEALQSVCRSPAG
jgi:hypothetical protein